MVPKVVSADFCVIPSDGFSFQAKKIRVFADVFCYTLTQKAQEK